MSLIKIFSLSLIFVFSRNSSAPAQVKLSELLEIEGARKIEIIGYGLVAGLDRSGDRASNQRGAVFTVQSISSMLRKFNINVDSDDIRTRNVAAVMVTASIGPYHTAGSEIDITISSIGDASSLNGGVLLQTPLINPATDELIAYGQGALIVGGINSELGGSRAARNPTLTATIPSGGNVVARQEFSPDRSKPLGLILRQPNYVNASRIADLINKTFETDLATVQNAGMLLVEWPEAFSNPGDMNFFISTVMDLETDIDVPARVVINERTGTVIAGGNVLIGEVFISHGGIKIQSQTIPLVSQPNAFGRGETVVVNENEAGFSEEVAKNVVVGQNTRVVDLAATLTNLGLSPKDIISIMQAIDKAGALKGKLIIM